MQGYLLETGRRQTEKREDHGCRSVPPLHGGFFFRDWRLRVQTEIHIYIYIYIYTTSVSVASPHASRCRSNFKAAQATRSAMATHRLSLLCRATRRLSPYIHQLIREYLVVRVGIPCPHVDDMLWRYVRQSGEFSFMLSGTIHPGIRKKKALPNMGADLDAVEPEAEELLEAEITICWFGQCGWSVASSGRSNSRSSVTRMLEDLRDEFDGRVPGPGAGMQAIVEAPCTAQQWQAFARRWIFGPPEPKQTSLRKWLRPRAA